jgi:flavin-dependent dehydrogenase
VTRSTLIAGGGVAGATAAAILARAGREVTLLERTAAATDKICGEFLSGEAQGVFGRIGLDISGLGGHRIHAVRLVRGERVAEARLPFQALGLSRRLLDEALLTHAASCGANVRRGVTVSRADGTALTLADGCEITADTLLLAVGKHDLRGLRRETPPPDALVGFKLHLRLSPAQRAALSGCIDLMLFPDCYAGLQLIEDGKANLCLLVRRARLERAGGTWDGLLDDLLRDNAHLRTRLTGAAPLHAPLTIYRVPYGFVHRPSPGDAPGVFRLGDQAAVIPSFTGDGMAIALHSATLAAGMVLAGASADAYHRRLRRDVASQVRRAWWLYRAGRWAPGQAALMQAAERWPRLLGLAATLTRVPPAALAASASGA